jgi:arylsulfatase A-like enzyme
MVSILDDHVGEILDLVTALGLDDNTLIMFTSDNGPHLEGGADPDYFDSNGPFTGYKRDLYEGGIRVPMIVKWKNHIAAGSKTGHPSAFWDIMPTLAELLNISLQGEVDGVSFLATLDGKVDQKKHDYLYWEFHEKGGRQALRKDDWKIVRYDIENEPQGNIQLFNLKDDPSESRDLAKDHPEKLNQLIQLMTNARVPNADFIFQGEN